MFVLGYWFLLCPDGSVCILIKLDCLNTVCTDTQQPSFVSTVHKMSRCLNAVKNVLFRSFSTPMYASELWCNFRKSCMQRLRVAYNFGCRALYNLPWRASVSSHQVQCNIPTFEALLRKYKYLFLVRCRKSNNVWLRALCSQIVCTRHYSFNTIIAFYAVNEWSNFDRGHKPQCLRILPRLVQFRN